MNPRGGNHGAGDDCARELAFLGPPISGIEHLRRGAKTCQRVQKFVTLHSILRKTLGREGHSQHIACARFDIDRPAPHFMIYALLFQ